MQKLEERIRELVCQIDDEEIRKADSLKNLRKTERGVKEYIYRSGEDQKNSERIKVMQFLKRIIPFLLQVTCCVRT